MQPAGSAVARRDPSFQPFPRWDPGPNGGSWAPPRAPTPCVCPGCGAGQAAYPRGAVRGSPRRGTALWGRESRGGVVRMGLDTLGQRELGRGGGHLGALHPVSILPGGLGSWGSPWEEVVLGRVASCPGSRVGPGCSPSSWVGLKESRMCIGRALRALSNFSRASSSTSGVLTVGPGRGQPLLPRVVCRSALGLQHTCPSPLAQFPPLPPRAMQWVCRVTGGKPAPHLWLSGSLPPPGPADTARSLHSPMPTPAWHGGPENAQGHCYGTENVTCHLFSGRDS